MIHYILQTLAFQLLFLIVYDLFLKRETFFSYNRLYLLLTPLLSLVLPFIKLPIIQENIPVEYQVQLPAIILYDLSVQTTAASEVVDSGWAFSIVQFWYLGILVCLGLFVFKLWKLFKLKRSGEPISISGVKVYYLKNSTSAFTFLNDIFIGESLSAEQQSSILLHEQIHVKQRHTLDLLFFELLRIIFWFNPLIYVFQSRIKALQEYMADAEVTKHKEKQHYYQDLLSEVFQTEKISFINTFFNHSLIKKRIIMLQKSKSKRIHQLKYLLLVPIVTGMLVYTSCSEDIEEKKPSTISEEIAEFKLALSSKDELTQEEKGELAAFILDIYPKDVAGISGEGIDGGDHRLTYQTNKEYWDEKLHEDANALPFAQLDKVPVFPGCENLSQEDAKACFQSKITAFIVENFKVENLKDSGLTGRQKIAAKFVITQEGKIEIAGIKANHPDLEAEALWTISQLPDMIPGEKDGKKVAVHYAVPIIFEMAE